MLSSDGCCRIYLLNCYYFFVTDRKDGLKAHIDAVHEKKRPHKCDYCDGAFFLRRDKERHLLKFHNIDVKKGGQLLITTPSC